MTSKRQLASRVQRLEQISSNVPLKPRFLDRYLAMDLSPGEIADWLFQQPWRRAHRATLAVAAQWEQERIRQNIQIDRGFTELETTAMVIAATPLDEEPPAEQVEDLRESCRVPDPEPPRPARRWPGRVSYERPHWFAASVYRIQLGGVEGLALRRDIAAGCYPISESTWQPHAWNPWLNPTLWFPNLGGETLFPVPQWTRCLRDGSQAEAYSAEDILDRFTPEETANWPE